MTRAVDGAAVVIGHLPAGLRPREAGPALAIHTTSQAVGRLGDVGRGDTFEIADYLHFSMLRRLFQEESMSPSYACNCGGAGMLRAHTGHLGYDSVPGFRVCVMRSLMEKAGCWLR